MTDKEYKQALQLLNKGEFNYSSLSTSEYEDFLQRMKEDAHRIARQSIVISIIAILLSLLKLILQIVQWL